MGGAEGEDGTDHTLRHTAAVLAGLVALASLASLTACGAEPESEIRVERPWARATPGAAANGVVYMSLSNRGSAPDRLIAIDSPISRNAMIHETAREGDMVTMRHVGELEIPPGEPTLLRPGGLHVMLMGLEAPIEEGQTFALRLIFERAGTVDVSVTAYGIGAATPDGE